MPEQTGETPQLQGSCRALQVPESEELDALAELDGGYKEPLLTLASGRVSFPGCSWGSATLGGPPSGSEDLNRR